MTLNGDTWTCPFNPCEPNINIKNQKNYLIIKSADKLGKNIPFVRIDFYSLNSFKSQKLELEFGNQLNITRSK